MENKWKIVILFLGLFFILPNGAWAQPQALNAEELAEVSGQSGVFLPAGNYDFNLQIKTIYYGDEGGQGESSAAYLSVNGLWSKGQLQVSAPVQIDVQTGSRLFGADQGAVLERSWEGVQGDLEQMSISGITVGSAPGAGKSFGSVGIIGLHVESSGHIQRWSH